ncbi:MAG: hypothetical protein H7281_19405 [Bacteriovorax sp.]|nr:hypothetical protein [Bacteriovorax sp.]
MKKRRIFDILLGLIFLSLLGLYLYDHYLLPTKPKIIARLRYTRAIDILRKKTKITENILNTTATSSACTLFLKNSAEISMNDYANEYFDHQLDAILKTCAGAFPTPLQSKIDDAILKCKTSTREHFSKECYGALMAAKTSSVATVIKSATDPDKLDAPILLQLVADKFNSSGWIENEEETLALVDALLDKEPSYLNGYKVKMLLLTMGPLNIKGLYKEELQDALEQAKRLNPDDPQVIEFDLSIRAYTFGLPKDEAAEVKKEALEYIEQEALKHPNKWIYDYHKAMLLYDGYDVGDGKYEQALALVEKAFKKFPNNERLQYTIRNLKEDDRSNKHRIKKPFLEGYEFNLDDL